MHATSHLCSSLIPVRTIGEFVASPTGKYVTSDSFVYFQTADHVSGFSLWGYPKSHDIRLLLQAMKLHHARTIQRHESLIDTSGLLGVDAPTFELFADGLAKVYQDMASTLSKQAVVRPSRLAGAVVAGFFDVLPPPYDAQTFAGPESAYHWLKLPAHTARPLQALIDGVRGAASLLYRLQCLLDASRGDQTCLQSAARALGVSERSLQRRLQESSTCFQHELQSARVRLAKRLMADRTLSLSAIAMELGCSSAAHFSTMFRNSTGMTPSQWRAAFPGE